MDIIIVIGIGAILVATGVITPKPKDDKVAEAEVVKTEEVVTPPPEIKPEPEYCYKLFVWQVRVFCLWLLMTVGTLCNHSSNLPMSNTGQRVGLMCDRVG